MTDDQIVIGVCGLFTAGLALLGRRFIRRKQWWAAAPVFLVALLLLAVIWFFSTFHMKMM
jgi:hypothetical protein